MQTFQKRQTSLSANAYEKFIVGEDYCVAHHDDKLCFLASRRFHIINLGHCKELLQKSDSFYSTYQHLDCLFTLFKYRFNEKVVAKGRKRSENVQRAVYFNRGNRGLDKTASIAKKETVEKKVQKAFFSPFEKVKSTPTSGSVFAERIELIKKTKFELELIKTVVCFHTIMVIVIVKLYLPKRNLSKLTVFCFPKRYRSVKW